MHRRLHLTALVSLLALPAAALAQEAAPVAAEAPLAAAASEPAPAAVTQQQLDAVDQRARIAERKVELLEEQALAAKATAPTATLGDRGFIWRSGDGAFSLRLRGLVQGDGRQYLDDKALAPKDTFVVRAVKPTIDATVSDAADFRLTTDFGSGTVQVLDAYGDLKPFAWLQLRAGKFKSPVGLERLQFDGAVALPERGLPTALAPNRDVGFDLHGAIAGGVFTYDLGVFNGAVDGGSSDADLNHAKDFVGRLFLQPLKNDSYSLLQGLGAGFAASTGNQKGSATGPGLPSYKTAGLNTFFSYLVDDKVPTNTVIAKGRHTRLSPQAYYYGGPIGLLAEYVTSTQELQKGTTSDKLTNTAWQVLGSFVLGGKPTYDGVTVDEPLSPKKGTWGALELAGRYNQLKIDSNTFPTYASLDKSARKAQGFGVALNWHWSRNIKLVAAFERTTFEGGAAKGENRPAENVAVQRLQAVF